MDEKLMLGMPFKDLDKKILSQAKKKGFSDLQIAHIFNKEEDDVYDQADAGGFIKINALRLRLLKARDLKAGRNT